MMMWEHVLGVVRGLVRGGGVFRTSAVSIVRYRYIQNAIHLYSVSHNLKDTPDI